MVFQSAILYPVFPDGVCFYTAFALTKILYRFIAFFYDFQAARTAKWTAKLLPDFAVFIDDF